ncbi:hypothetical protein DWW33_04080 [Roseburia sp. AF15-21]|uniref:hypothetical protein n=1 Tax=Roseburia sp. AF15-21 TaxID=2293128 RepID=UPI000E522FAE|nr:hypothetical protein [Roseburia sp. AF15-21]RHR89439.1 hypothetical protein DWW33_04080 [Roseburia sp. AF15-21]
MSEFQYVELSSACVSQDVLQKFNCGHPDFNNFLVDDAVKYSDNGDGVTYILVDKDDYDNKKISTIFAFATIQSTSLQYYDIKNEDKVYSISGVEIRYFAIAKKFHGQTAYLIDSSKHYSTIFFEWLLTDLYEMSTKTIGFQAIFLRANGKGEKLYRRKKFVDATKYIIPYEEDDPLGKCIPMCLMIQDDIYNIFGIDE